MEKIKYEKLATLAADGTRVECNSFAIRRLKISLPEEYNSVLQKRKKPLNLEISPANCLIKMMEINMTG